MQCRLLASTQSSCQRGSLAFFIEKQFVTQSAPSPPDFHSAGFLCAAVQRLPNALALRGG
jgi:hypothetical protein